MDDLFLFSKYDLIKFLSMFDRPFIVSMIKAARHTKWALESSHERIFTLTNILGLKFHLKLLKTHQFPYQLHINQVLKVFLIFSCS